MHLRSIKGQRIEVSIYEPIGQDKEGNEITLLDTLKTDGETVTEVVERRFEQARLLEKVKSLSKREKKVLEMRFGLLDGHNYTQREVARKLNISRSYVSRIEKRAIKKLLKELQIKH